MKKWKKKYDIYIYRIFIEQISRCVVQVYKVDNAGRDLLI